MGRSLGVVAACAALMSFGAVAASAQAQVTARGSVEQVQVTGAKKGAKLTLATAKGRSVAGKIDAPIPAEAEPGSSRSAPSGCPLPFGG